MAKGRWMALLGICASSSLGILFRHNPKSLAAGNGSRILYYRDPMHPSYTSEKPGTAPDCGMALEPVYAGADSSMPAAMRLSPGQRQNIGVRLEKVERSSATGKLRALGRVAVDEARIFPVITGADGWVRQVFASNSGSPVAKGQPLAVVYGHEYVNVQRAYLYALRSLQTAPRPPEGDSQNDPKFALQEARLNLLNMGFSEAQIQQLAVASQASLEVTLSAPADGVLVARNAFPLQRFERGAELFRIADLSSVWIIADLFGDDARYIHGGENAKVTLPDRPGQAFRATITKTLPRFDAEARTLQVRLETANPDLILRPDLFVDVEFPIHLPVATTVPAYAIVESGLTKTVFVEKDPGTFEPRAVETGWHFGERVEILRGLDPGESIVVAGNFLLGAEFRMLRSVGHGNH